MGTSGSTWHYHGVPSCWTSTVDGSTGASHIIGIALDGFPIYGGRDVNGNAVSASSLDACNGITSATPEFPSGAYHYVLPIGVTNSSSSMNCYTGTVSATLMARMEKLRCKMKNADGTPLKGSVMRADLTKDDTTKANRMKAGMQTPWISSPAKRSAATSARPRTSDVSLPPGRFPNTSSRS